LTDRKGLSEVDPILELFRTSRADFATLLVESERRRIFWTMSVSRCEKINRYAV
jgi:hypothetical protein